MTVTNYAKKSRHGTAASSVSMFDIGQMIKPGSESVAPARSLASKSLCRAKSGIISRDAICSGQLNPDTWLGRSSAFAGGIPS
ncbi:hypothetical protein, partial [Aeromonas veronii]|uniref:hypothetical protein n=1 Tax=Aeromonas veronii TaxID=654 RepID=UPI0019D5024C